MTLYQVDRVVNEVGKRDDALQAFMQDPEAYLQGMDLEEQERKALATCDCAALWLMGAHPFILQAFVRRVWMAQGKPSDQATRDYKATIKPLGRPSYAT
jgi:hypothetical protein